jgi:hypothetical protein
MGGGETPAKAGASFIALLEEQNGGYLARPHFPTSITNYSATGYVPVDVIFGISPDESDVNSILCTGYMTREWDLPDGLVLISGDGHTWIALDYRYAGVEPSVTYIDIEMHQEIRLAESFAKFVANLVPEESPANNRVKLSRRK